MNIELDPTSLTPANLRRVQELKKTSDAALAEVAKILSGKSPATDDTAKSEKPKKKRKVMSEEAKDRIRQAQKRIWAERKAKKAAQERSEEDKYGMGIKGADYGL